jgi:hypothetical protein
MAADLLGMMARRCACCLSYCRAPGDPPAPCPDCLGELCERCCDEVKRLDQAKMFIEWSPRPRRVVYTDRPEVYLQVRLPKFGSPSSQLDVERVELRNLIGCDGGLVVDGWYGWEPRTRTVCVWYVRFARIMSRVASE